MWMDGFLVACLMIVIAIPDRKHVISRNDNDVAIRSGHAVIARNDSDVAFHAGLIREGSGTSSPTARYAVACDYG